jgi:hypothetical protein
MKFTQLAIYVPNQSAVVDSFKDFFREDMYSDSLHMMGAMRGESVFDVPLALSFNHTIMDRVEIEYITSSSKAHWHQKKIDEIGDVPFISHLGVYCKDLKEYFEYCEKIEKAGFVCLQTTSSYRHSNKRDDGTERKYFDSVYDTEAAFGFNIKLSAKGN